MDLILIELFGELFSCPENSNLQVPSVMRSYGSYFPVAQSSIFAEDEYDSEGKGKGE
jgi:hypothetical protein